MTTTNSPPPGTVVCPWCTSHEMLRDGIPLPDLRCDDCDGEDYIPDPRIAIWNGSDPAAMIELLGKDADEERLRKWAEHCESVAGKRARIFTRPIPDVLTYWTVTAFTSVDSEDDEQLHGIAQVEAADWLRCVFPPPWLRRTCRQCNGHGGPMFEYPTSGNDCRHCQGQGTLPGPEIDKRCLDSTVMDMLRTARGGQDEISNDPRTGYCRKIPPDYSILPILADKLEDNGCDCRELLDHLRAEMHVPGECWAIRVLTEGAK